MKKAHEDCVYSRNPTCTAHCRTWLAAWHFEHSLYKECSRRNPLEMETAKKVSFIKFVMLTMMIMCAMYVYRERETQRERERIQWILSVSFSSLGLDYYCYYYKRSYGIFVSSGIGFLSLSLALILCYAFSPTWQKLQLKNNHIMPEWQRHRQSRGNHMAKHKKIIFHCTTRCHLLKKFFLCLLWTR